MKSKNSNLALALLIFLPLIYLIKAISFNCINAIDYSIYQQAINNLSFSNLNPYVSIRNISIFNEHTDPIIFFAIPLFKLLNYNVYSLAIFEWLFLFSSFIFILRASDKSKNFNIFILSILLLTLNRSIMSGFIFSGHPVTWAILPLLILVYSIYKDKFTLTYITCISLCFFKETFPFGIFGLSFGFLFEKQYKKFFSLFVLSLIFIIFEFKLKKLLLGPTLDYGNSFVSEIIKDPIGRFIYILKHLSYSDILKVFGPSIFPIILIFKRCSQKAKINSLKILFLLLPYFVLHVIILRFHFHHASKFGAILLGMIFFSGILGLMYKKEIYIMIFLFLISGFSQFKKITIGVFTNRFSACSVENYPETFTISKSQLLESLDLDHKNVYSSGGIIPELLKPNINVYHHSFSEKLEKYDAILLEVNGYTNTWPLSKEQILNIKERCLQYSISIIQDDDNFFYAHGNFPSSCIYQ